MVQTRHAEWRRSARQRRRADAVTLNCAFPGVMSLLSLVDPRSQTIWRVSFAAVAILGVVAPLALGIGGAGGRGNPVAGAALLAGAFLYTVVVAIAPGVPSGSGSRSRRCERRRSSSRCSSSWA